MRSSIQETLRDVIKRFDEARDQKRDRFGEELSEMSQRELNLATEQLRARAGDLVAEAGSQAARIDATRGELEQRIEDRLAESRSALEGRLSGVEQALVERIERSLASTADNAERIARERSESLGQSASAALGEQVSALVERELKSALERQSAALAAASLHHRRALEKTVADRGQATAAEIEQTLVVSLDRRLGEIQAVIDSQVRQRSERFEADLIRLRAELAGDHERALEVSSASFAEQVGKAVADLEQRTLVDGGAAVNRLVAEAIVGAEARLDGQVQGIRSELTESVERSAAALGSRIEAEIADRLASARSSLEESARESARAGQAELEASLTQHAAEQVTLRSQELRQDLKSETETLLTAKTNQLRQEVEAWAREGEQRATLSATEAAHGELVTRVDTELKRLTQGNQVKLGDHEHRVGELVEQGRAEIDQARAQIEDVARGLERKARRHELKLVKAESKKRIQNALQGLETQAASIEAEAARAEERLQASKSRLQEAETRITQALQRIDADSGDLGLRAGEALARLEAAIGEIEGSRCRVLSVERRVGESELHVRKVGEMSDKAVAVELRIRRANEAEADAAAKISDAERRLLDLVDR